MGGECAVGAVDAVVRAVMDDDRQLGGRYGQGLDATNPPNPALLHGVADGQRPRPAEAGRGRAHAYPA